MRLRNTILCFRQTHVDIIEDFDKDLIDQLWTLTVTHNFLVFEDRKFADIGPSLTRVTLALVVDGEPLCRQHGSDAICGGRP